MCSNICPSATGQQSTVGCVKHGRSKTTTRRSIGCTLWLSSWSAAIPARQDRCASKRWQSGEMALRWTAAGMLEAERQFRMIIGYRDLAKLALAIERDLARTTVPSPTEETGAAQRRAPVVFSLR